MLFIKSKKMLLSLNVLNTGSERTEFTYLLHSLFIPSFTFFFYYIETYVRCAIYRLIMEKMC